MSYKNAAKMQLFPPRTLIFLRVKKDDSQLFVMEKEWDTRLLNSLTKEIMNLTP
jgi:hypothetical protein